MHISNETKFYVWQSINRRDVLIKITQWVKDKPTVQTFKWNHQTYLDDYNKNHINRRVQVKESVSNQIANISWRFVF